MVTDGVVTYTVPLLIGRAGGGSEGREAGDVMLRWQLIRLVRLFSWLLLLAGAALTAMGGLQDDAGLVIASGAVAMVVAFLIDLKARPLELRYEQERKRPAPEPQPRGFDVVPLRPPRDWDRGQDRGEA